MLFFTFDEGPFAKLFGYVIHVYIVVVRKETLKISAVGMGTEGTVPPIRTLAALTFSYGLVYVGFETMQNLQSSLNADGNIGLLCLTIIYTASFISAFLCPLLIRVLGAKNWLMCGWAAIGIYIAGNFHPEPYILLPTAFVVGSVMSSLGAMIGIYISAAGRSYVTRRNLEKERLHGVVSGFNGLFFFGFKSAQLIGNPLSSAILSRSDGSDWFNASLAENNTCGAAVCATDNDDDHVHGDVDRGDSILIQPPEKRAVYLLLSVFLVFVLAGFLVTFFFLPNINVVDDDDDDDNNDNGSIDNEASEDKKGAKLIHFGGGFRKDKGAESSKSESVAFRVTCSDEHDKLVETSRIIDKPLSAYTDENDILQDSIVKNSIAARTGLNSENLENGASSNYANKNTISISNNLEDNEQAYTETLDASNMEMITSEESNLKEFDKGDADVVSQVAPKPGKQRPSMKDQFLSCAKMLRTRFILLVPLFAAQSVTIMMLFTGYTQAFVSCRAGVQTVGYVMVSFGLAGCIVSPLVNSLTRLTGRIALMVLFILLDVGTLLAMVFWVPSPSAPFWSFLVVPALVGVTDGISQPQINALLSVEFKGQPQAFATFHLTRCVAFAACLVLSLRTCLYHRLYTTLALYGLGMLGYLALEVKVHNSKR